MGWKATGRGGIVAAWAAAAVCAAAPSPGYEFRRAPDGTPLRWERSPDPIPYAIVCPGGDEIPDEGAVGAIQDAFAAWKASARRTCGFASPASRLMPMPPPRAW